MSEKNENEEGLELEGVESTSPMGNVGFGDIEEDSVYIKPVKPCVAGLVMNKMPAIVTRQNKQKEDFKVFQLYFKDKATKAIFDPTLYIPLPASEVTKDKEAQQGRLIKRYLAILGTLAPKSKIKGLVGNTWEELLTHALTLLDEKEVLGMTFDVKMSYPRAGGTFAGFPAIGIVISSNKYPTVLTAWNGDYDKDEIVGGNKKEDKSETSVDEL
jgi:hypothetical protein